MIAHSFERVAGTFGPGNLVFQQFQRLGEGLSHQWIRFAHQGGQAFFFYKVKRLLGGIIGTV